MGEMIGETKCYFDENVSFFINAFALREIFSVFSFLLSFCSSGCKREIVFDGLSGLGQHH